MSYQTYVQSLVDSKGCVMGGVYDITHGTPWHDITQPTSCKATAEEILHVKAGILSSFSTDKPPHLEGIKYTKMGEEPGKLIMMKSNHPQSEDKQMACVYLGRKFIMVGAMKGPAERSVMGAVEDTGKYLDDALGA